MKNSLQFLFKTLRNNQSILGFSLHQRHRTNISFFLLLLGTIMWQFFSEIYPNQASALPPQIIATQSEPIRITGTQGNYSAQILVNRSQEQVWRVLTDYNGFSRFIPDIVSSRLIESNGARRIVDQVYFAPYTFGFKPKARLAFNEIHLKSVEMNLISSDRLNVLQGRMLLEPKSAQQTLINYNIRIEPSIPFFMKNSFYTAYETQLLQNLRMIKKQIESQ